MRDTTHTRGEWRLDGGDDRCHPCVRTDGRIIATVYAKDGDAEGLANGHLVSASRDLFRACVAMMRVHTKPFPQQREIDAAHEMTEAALAKAVGHSGGPGTMGFDAAVLEAEGVTP